MLYFLRQNFSGKYTTPKLLKAPPTNVTTAALVHRHSTCAICTSVNRISLPLSLPNMWLAIQSPTIRSRCHENPWFLGMVVPNLELIEAIEVALLASQMDTLLCL